jgi:hypothetical protein
MDAAGFSEILVPVCVSTWQNIPKDDIRHSHFCESSEVHLNCAKLSNLATEQTQNVGLLSSITVTLKLIQHEEQEANSYETGEYKDLAYCTCAMV